MRLIDRRLGLIFCGFMLLFSVALARTAWLQGVRGSELRADARTQQVTTVAGARRARPRAGPKRQASLAVSEDAATVIATPYQVKNPAGTAERLAAILPGTRTRLRGGALRPRVRVRLPGQEGQPGRGRPGREAGHRGHLDAPRQPPPLSTGRAGRAGDRRRRRRERGPDRPGAVPGRDAGRRQRRAGGRPRRPRGADSLRHDQAGQRRPGRAADDRRRDPGPSPRSAIAAVGEQYSAAGASAVVMDPDTGDVLAMANWPGFDPTRAGRGRARAARQPRHRLHL